MAAKTLPSINPADGRTLAEYPVMEDAALLAALEESHRAFLAWRRTDFNHRSGLLRKAAALLRAEKDRLAALMADEMGKPVRGRDH